MQQRSNMLKVLTPVEGKNGKTFWIRVGNAFINRDGSTNVYLNAYPTSGKLQIRELDVDEQRPAGAGTGPRQSESASMDPPGMDSAQDDLPF